MTLYERIINLLKVNSIDYKEIRHEPVRTSKEAAEIRGCTEEEGAKSLVFIADNGYVNVILQGNKLVDKEKLKRILTVSKFKMASSEEVLKIAGCEVGGVPPFGNLFDKPIPIYVDEGFLKNEFMEFNAGDRSISIRMKVNDWVKIAKPAIAGFTI